MALKKQRKPRTVSRLRAGLRKLKSKLKKPRKKTMAFRRNRFSRSFGRMRSRFRSFRPFRRNRRPSYGRSRGGFSNRVPIIGFRMPSLFIWLAVIGGGIYMFKDHIKPLIDKFKSQS